MRWLKVQLPSLPRRTRGWIAAGLGVAWLSSLFVPAAHLVDGDAPEGIVILMIGWIGLLMLQPAWLGNLLIWIALLLVVGRRVPPKALRISGALLLGCCIAACFWSDLPDDSGSNPIAAFGAGFYLWMLAVCGAGIMALVFASTKQPFE